MRFSSSDDASSNISFQDTNIMRRRIIVANSSGKIFLDILNKILEIGFEVAELVRGIHQTVSNSAAFESAYEYDDDIAIPVLDELNLSESTYTTAITAGLMVSLATIAYVAVVYIPSHVSTVLKYRCGVIKSLGSDEFQKYRVAVDSVSLICTASASTASSLFLTGTIAMLLSL